jgi:hypothetical protein
MPEVISIGDNIFRGVHHPVAFKSKAFDIGKFWKLFTADDNPKFIEASVIWEKFAPTLGYVNSYGCRTSLKRNKKKEKDGKLGTKDVYCGAYQFKFDHVRGLVGLPGLMDISAADVIHKIETDEIAHCNLQIQIKDDVDDAEHVKTAIIARLWQVNRGPINHTCAVDINLVPHPNSKLAIPPSGRYVDDRSIIRRTCHVLRFIVLSCRWRWCGAGVS